MTKIALMCSSLLALNLAVSSYFFSTSAVSTQCQDNAPFVPAVYGSEALYSKVNAESPVDTMYDDTYHPMVLEGATWIMVSYADDVLLGYYGWRITGDTLIGSNTYKKVYYLYAKEIIEDSVKMLSYTISSNPQFYLREDVDNKKVYATGYAGEEWNCTTYTDSSEIEIYDFSFDVGDTLQYCNGEHLYVANAADTVTVYGYELPYYHDLSMYQQIGREQGLLSDPFLNILPGYGDYVVAYCVAEEVGCPFILDPTSTKTFTTDQKITIFPNPVHDRMQIHSPDSPITHLELISMNGHVITSQPQNNVHHLSHNTSSLAGGLYLVAIHTIAGIQVHKIHIYR